MRISDWSSDVCSSDLLSRCGGEYRRWHDGEGCQCCACHASLLSAQSVPVWFGISTLHSTQSSLTDIRASRTFDARGRKPLPERHLSDHCSRICAIALRWREG